MFLQENKGFWKEIREKEEKFWEKWENFLLGGLKKNKSLVKCALFVSVVRKR